MVTIEERVASIEATLPHLATKADVKSLSADIALLEGRIRGDLLKVVIGLASLQLIGLGAVAAIVRFLG